MFNFIKGLFKIQFQDDQLLLGFLANVKVFKGPSQAIMD
jgi:hypothetical protein